MSVSQKVIHKIEEMRRILSEDELEDSYFLSDGYLHNFLEEKRLNVLKAVKRFRKTMAWRQERQIKELILNNEFTGLRDFHDRMGVDRHGRPVFVHCPTIDNLNEIFGDELGFDVNFNEIHNIQDVKKSLKEIEQHTQNSSRNQGFNVMADYKENVIHAGILYLERILATIKTCDTNFRGRDSSEAVRSAILILDLSHYRIFAELANNIEDMKSLAWLYIPKLVTLYTEGYELMKNHYPGLLHEIYLLNVPKRLSRIMIFLAKPYVRADWLNKLKIFGRKQHKWHKALVEKIHPEVMQQLFSEDINEELIPQ